MLWIEKATLSNVPNGVKKYSTLVADNFGTSGDACQGGRLHGLQNQQRKRGCATLRRTGNKKNPYCTIATIITIVTIMIMLKGGNSEASTHFAGHQTMLCPLVGCRYPIGQSDRYVIVPKYGDIDFFGAPVAC